MSKIEEFLTAEEEKAIVDAIRDAEKNTSGEIRVHLEKTSEIDVFDRAMDVFHNLKMDNTKLQNGVLIYVAVEDKTFVIYGDKGINDVVSDDFWDTTRNAIQLQFKQGNFKQGLVDGIEKAGMALAKYFPWKKDDIDELPNTISKG
ncbi:TPM domain-containing protein [Bizionia argentinensis JUB59]|uniref:TPM domain-containing protein n=2 Tax=Bizionia argentinensis JUB59 TaxID=1046627 RepID=G2EA45_9FLAO|nr:TPM domain-containing protein [Bizionia argentinensis]EGV44639.1 TPM domain-containing protein [Bizionia argentinensis JUB59]2LT2_A Chain A, NMR structure of BA42 protein from the psychrophilic bacteria Bizionia argentinensis sp. nov. [Bizionia argentinensis JUB59]2MPB_A Chain A, BA42 [Bizionia argentinensis JUB59]